MYEQYVQTMYEQRTQPRQREVVEQDGGWVWSVERDGASQHAHKELKEQVRAHKEQERAHRSTLRELKRAPTRREAP